MVPVGAAAGDRRIGRQVPAGGGSPLGGRRRVRLRRVQLAGRAPPGGIVCLCGLHVRIGPGALEIGYWVRTDPTCRGIATSAAGALTVPPSLCLGVERVEIHCDQSKPAECRVAAKLGYILARTEPKEPAAPGETGRFMVWVRASGSGSSAAAGGGTGAAG